MLWNLGFALWVCHLSVWCAGGHVQAVYTPPLVSCLHKNSSPPGSPFSGSVCIQTLDGWLQQAMHQLNVVKAVQQVDKKKAMAKAALRRRGSAVTLQACPRC